MDPDLTRLAAISGDHDLSLAEVCEVLQVSPQTVSRLVNGRGHATLEAKRHAGRGEGRAPKIRVPRAAVVRYLVRITTGDKAAILAAIEQQCPQYLPAVQDLAHEMPQVPTWLQGRRSTPAAALPANVIPMRSTRKRPQAPVAMPDPFAGHPDLFPELLKPAAS